MFAVEVEFKDQAHRSEFILVRRPQMLIGGSDLSHVVIKELEELGIQLRISRKLGRRFICQPLGLKGSLENARSLDGVFNGEAKIDLGVLRLHLMCLDVDLKLKTKEAPDKAGVRILRQALAMEPNDFPAIMIKGPEATMLSFLPSHSIRAGRSKNCELRLDLSDVSGEHARIGYENGQFWVEDLGSTNGTFVAGHQISGRVPVAAGEQIVLGREVVLVGVTSDAELSEALQIKATSRARSVRAEPEFPMLISHSEVARPARLMLALGSNVKIGRDPGCDLWLGAPHISRKHLELEIAKSGVVTVRDFSTNGVVVNGKRVNPEKGTVLDKESAVMDFGGGLTIALCFDADAEERFKVTKGSTSTFMVGEGDDLPVATRNSFVTRAQSVADSFNMSPGLGIGPMALLAKAYRSFCAYGTIGKLVMGLVVLGFLIIGFIVLSAVISAVL